MAYGLGRISVTMYWQASWSESLHCRSRWRSRSRGRPPGTGAVYRHRRGADDLSLFGGTRLQIAGPTGAFVAVLAIITAQHGIAGLQIATLMAGMILLAFGFARLGAVIKYIPNPVIAGFTAGIGVIIFVGQWKEFFGLSPAPSGPRFHEKFLSLLEAWSTINPATTGLGLLALAILILGARFMKRIPAPLVALVVVTVVQAIAQFKGVATIGSAFGGFAATGAIARTATNIRNGATSPLAGIVHSLFLILVILLLAPLASTIPLCCLSAILFIVAWNMSEVRHFLRIIRGAPRPDVAVLLLTFLSTVFVDLVVAVNVGVILATLLFMRRMSDAVRIEPHTGGAAKGCHTLRGTVPYPTKYENHRDYKADQDVLGAGRPWDDGIGQRGLRR